jgi:glyoxylase-like metal-dependent hydrolase (beta-lactamase superfamily II)
MMERPRAGQFGPIEVVPGEYAEKWRMVRSCTLVVRSGRELAVIDPAANENVLAQLAPAATLCVNSHPHADHILYNPMFLHVPLYGPRGDAHFYQPADLSELGPDGELLVGAHVARERASAAHLPERLLQDGEVLAIGEVDAHVVGLSGHTPGMLGFLFPRQRLAYLADFDLTDFGPWYGNSSSNPDQFPVAAARIRALPADHFVTSHEVGIVTRDELDPLLERFLAHLERRDARIYDRLADGAKTIDELAGGIVYPKSAVARSPWLMLWERQHIRKHLDRLLQSGQCVRAGIDRVARA